ncbi:MAG: dynamin family protein [Ruminococcus sp.]
MILFKIISDPYKREIRFETIASDTNEAIPVTEADNSDLVSDELIHGFFPYNVKRIVDEIYAMKSKQGQPIHIIFEGTDDEYSDLKDLCSDEYYKDKMVLLPQEHYLNSAKDILPKISEIFQDMQPLIEESVRSNEQVALNRRKFEDAVDKQVIPICVIGNYSSGKSTFINALVGKEILPSGDDPVTDCVYQITRSQNAETGYVEFEYRGLPIKFSMDEYNRGNGCTVSGAGKCEDDFVSLIQQKLDAIASKPVHIRIHTLLAIIEEHKKKRKRDNAEKDIDSLIKITLPFSKEGVLSQSQCRYVIFDTPGEGSATNIDHSETLERQMRSLSNGLIMFITDNKSLDKVEGRDLCEKLIAMECFDNRFTMVIANRADCAKLPREGFQEEDIENKIGQTVCQTLHSHRVFYVSSIVGLGAKQGEEFIDEDYQDVFDKEIESYTNPDAKHPKSLYRYDIIPEQIKRRCVERSERESNRAFANSGLFWIEQEIRIFAEIYSPYNKCTQSKHFLDEIIAETSDRIDENQKGFEAAKKTLNEKLEDEESACVEALEKRAEELCNDFSGNYPTSYMQSTVNSAEDAIKCEELEKRQSEIEADIKEKNDYVSHKEDARFFKNDNQTEDADSNTIAVERETDTAPEKKGIVGDVWSTVKKTAQRTAKFAADTLHSTQDTIDKKCKLHDLEKQIEAEVSGILFGEVKKKFDSDMKQHQTDLESASEKYWSNASEDFRAKMIDAVTNSEGISEEKKKELEEIIASYEALEFDKIADKVFNFDDFKRFFSNSLNLSKLTTRYNTLMHDYLIEMLGNLRTSHEGSFTKWEQSLLQELKKNIIKLNPELRKLQEQIDAQAQQISNLKNRKERLLGYQLEIEHLMGWN